MTDPLGLPHLRTVDVQEMGALYLVKAEGDVVPTACPACGGGLYRHGSQRQAYLDTPLRGKPVHIELERKRFRCKACGKTMFEPLPAMDSKRLATMRMVHYIGQNCLSKTFAELSREVGVDDKTIRHIFDDFVAWLNQSIVFTTPEVLGIHEIKIIGQPRVLLTNAQSLTLIDILPSCSPTELSAYLKSMRDREKVCALAIDMNDVYRRLVTDAFPGRPVVIDRYCMAKLADESMEKIRQTVRRSADRRARVKLKDDRLVLHATREALSDEDRNKLESWVAMYPALGAAYVAKEALHDLYSYSRKEEAQKAAQAWLETLDEEVAWAFEDAVGAMRKWWNDIFNYFNFPLPAGYLVKILQLAKGISHMGRGYSFDVVRAQLLFDDAPKVRHSTREVGGSSPAALFGPSISALVKKLESGAFS